MSQLFRLPSSVKRDSSIEIWMKEHTGELGEIAKHWFGVMRARGDDVREVMHDGHPTACVADAAEIVDPDGLPQGTGKFMRPVKLSPAHDLDATALSQLIVTACADMKARV